MNEELFKALADLEKEKGIPMDFMLDRLKAALTAAYRRDNPDGGEVDFVMDKAARQMRMFALKTVVEEVENPNAEVTAAEAESITGKPAAIGDVVRFELDTRSFGRIAAQTAKQVIIQGIRESERDALYEEYSAKTNEILTALVTKNDRRTGIVYLTLKGGRGEEQSLILPPSEQIKGEEIREGEYLKVYLIGVQMGAKGTQIQISRTHSGLVKRLFEMEVPEIYDGVVDIVSIAREPGSRTKIAVSSTTATSTDRRLRRPQGSARKRRCGTVEMREVDIVSIPTTRASLSRRRWRRPRCSASASRTRTRPAAS